MKIKSILVCGCLAAFLHIGSLQLHAQSATPNPVKPTPKKTPATKKQLLETQKLDLANRIKTNAESLRGIQASLENLKISEASYREVMRLLQKQRVELTIEISGLDARLKLLKEVAQKKQEEMQNKSDSKTALLSKYVANQKTIFDRIVKLYSKGTVSNLEIKKAEQLLLDAKLKLATARAEAAPEVAQISEIALELASNNARLQTVSKLLKSYTEARGLIESADITRRNYESSILRFQNLERQMDEIRLNDFDN